MDGTGKCFQEEKKVNKKARIVVAFGGFDRRSRDGGSGEAAQGAAGGRAGLTQSRCSTCEVERCFSIRTHPPQSHPSCREKGGVRTDLGLKNKGKGQEKNGGEWRLKDMDGQEWLEILKACKANQRTTRSVRAETGGVKLEETGTSCSVSWTSLLEDLKTPSDLNGVPGRCTTRLISAADGKEA
eukprot:354689-Hanusia_phi.AAC.3